MSDEKQPAVAGTFGTFNGKVSAFATKRKSSSRPLPVPPSNSNRPPLPRRRIPLQPSQHPQPNQQQKSIAAPAIVTIQRTAEGDDEDFNVELPKKAATWSSVPKRVGLIDIALSEIGSGYEDGSRRKAVSSKRSTRHPRPTLSTFSKSPRNHRMVDVDLGDDDTPSPSTTVGGGEIAFGLDDLKPDNSSPRAAPVACSKPLQKFDIAPPPVLLVKSTGIVPETPAERRLAAANRSVSEPVVVALSPEGSQCDSVLADTADSDNGAPLSRSVSQPIDGASRPKSSVTYRDPATSSSEPKRHSMPPEKERLGIRRNSAFRSRRRKKTQASQALHRHDAMNIDEISGKVFVSVDADAPQWKWARCFMRVTENELEVRLIDLTGGSTDFEALLENDLLSMARKVAADSEQNLKGQISAFEHMLTSVDERLQTSSRTERKAIEELRLSLRKDLAKLCLKLVNMYLSQQATDLAITQKSTSLLASVDDSLLRFEPKVLSLKSVVDAEFFASTTPTFPKYDFSLTIEEMGITKVMHFRADTRANRIHWLLGLKLLLSRHGVGSLLEASVLPRLDVLHEIHDTENKFLTKIDLLLREAKVPMLEQKLITEEEAEEIFGNLSEIYELNLDILAHMTHRFEDAWQHGKACAEAKIADVWLESLEKLYLFEDYAFNYHQRARATIERLKQANKRFRVFLAEHRSVRLESDLLGPIQRVPRYRLLFRDLLSKTPKGHAEYGSVKLLVDKLAELGNSLNERVRRGERQSAIAEMLSQLTDAPPHLTTDADVSFIRQGVLTKVTMKYNQPVLLILFSDFFVYAHNIAFKWRYRDKIDLAYVWVRDLHDTANVKHAFQLVTTRKTHFFMAKSAAEKTAWIRDINSAIDAWIERNPSYAQYRSFARLQMRPKKGLWRFLGKDLWTEVAESQECRPEARPELVPELNLLDMPQLRLPVSSATSSAQPIQSVYATSEDSSNSANVLAHDELEDLEPATEPSIQKLYAVKYVQRLCRSVVLRMEASSSSLSLNCSYVLALPNVVILWHGGESTEEDKAYARSFAHSLAENECGEEEPVSVQRKLKQSSDVEAVCDLLEMCYCSRHIACDVTTVHTTVIVTSVAQKAIVSYSSDLQAVTLPDSGTMSHYGLDDANAKEAFFWNALGLTKDRAENVKKLQNALLSRPWDNLMRDHVESMKLFCIQELKKPPPGSHPVDLVQVTVEQSSPLTRDSLSSKHSYVLDVGSTVFVWAGEHSSDSEKIWAMLKTEDQLARPRAAGAEMAWVNDGAETAFFLSHFEVWESEAASTPRESRKERLIEVGRRMSKRVRNKMSSKRQ